MTTTKKHNEFVKSELLNELDVLNVPGVGPSAGWELNEAGFETAEQLLEKFEKAGEVKFERWLRTATTMKDQYIVNCCNALKEWRHKNPRSPSNRPPRSSRQDTPSRSQPAKHEVFVNTVLLNELDVFEVPGVGPSAGWELNEAGFETAEQLLEKFEKAGEVKFERWLRTATTMKDQYIVNCCNALKEWRHKNPRSPSDRPPRSSRQDTPSRSQPATSRQDEDAYILSLPNHIKRVAQRRNCDVETSWDKFVAGQKEQLTRLENYFRRSVDGLTADKLDYFCYLLLDPRQLKSPSGALLPVDDRPARIKFLNQLSPCERLCMLVSAVFYVGKGQGRRPFEHAREAEEMLEKGTADSANAKLRRIIDIWDAGDGHIVIELFHKISSVEALAREYLLINAAERSQLTNVQSVSFGVRGFTEEEERDLGIYLFILASMNLQDELHCDEIEAIRAMVGKYEASMGYNLKTPELAPPGWSWLNAVFFCTSLYTSIGFGWRLFPKTIAGRVFTMVYSFVGIPFFFAMTGDLGLTVFDGCYWIWWKCVVWWRSREEPEFSEEQIRGFRTSEYRAVYAKELSTFPVSLGVILSIVLLAVSSGLAQFIEPNWSYFDANYYFVTSFMMIGLGDISPSAPDHGPEWTLVPHIFLLLLSTTFIGLSQHVLSRRIELAFVTIDYSMHMEFRTRQVEPDISTMKSNKGPIAEEAQIALIARKLGSAESFYYSQMDTSRRKVLHERWHTKANMECVEIQTNLPKREVGCQHLMNIDDNCIYSYGDDLGEEPPKVKPIPPPDMRAYVYKVFDE